MTKSEIFTAAWELAERGALDFGGSKKEYFAESLRIVLADNAKMASVEEGQERVALLNSIHTNASKALENGANIDMAKIHYFVRRARNNKEYASMDYIKKMADHFKNKVA